MERHRVTITYEGAKPFKYYDQKEKPARYPRTPWDNALRAWMADHQASGCSGCRLLFDVEEVRISPARRILRRRSGEPVYSESFVIDLKHAIDKPWVISTPLFNVAERLFPGRVRYPKAVYSVSLHLDEDAWHWTVHDSRGEHAGDVEGTTPASSIAFASRRMGYMLQRSWRHDLAWPWTQIGEAEWVAAPSEAAETHRVDDPGDESVRGPA